MFRKPPLVILLLFLLCSCTSLQGGRANDEQNARQSEQPSKDSSQREAITSKSDSQSVQMKKQGAASPDHVVIVVEENHSEQKIIGNPSAPYINGLVNQGAYFTQSYATDHPSQPNYLVLFSGSNQGIRSDSCGHILKTPNLASELIKAKYTFGGFSEDLPSTGSTVCTHKQYGRKHSPWVNFTNVPTSANMTMASFPSDYNKLPTVSFVIPNLDHDMHDGTIQAADDWLKKNLAPYLEWAKTHNSLFILTWDEDDYGSRNHIPTIMVGEHVRQAKLNQKITHLSVLRMLEELYHLPYLGKSSTAEPITNVWKN
ncbi:acid phosphatase [Paenibacillus sp. J23TS9]|uniref:alkaline phosphatase family protein n=1 Tax=Paenibacillus sp. J23TS9 TaxID=2807193 RepID=UPI001B0D7099|nr:alkaline phosphatase family protein [Paenibacillus sp. J23TS9]GIP26876.1 acid phosphatase [Paenibacillus sp. J23TS9]